MPFCTSCGASVEAAAKFCSKCGATMTGAGAAPASSTPAAPASGGGGVLKIILIVIGVIFLLGVIGAGTAAYLGYRAVKAAKEAESSAGQIRVEMPGGNASAADATKIAEQMGVEVYPGAEPQQGGGAISMGGFSVAGANFLSSDPPAQVADFYQKQYPKAMLASQAGDHYSIMVNTSHGMVTVAIEPYQGRTRISIARMTGAKPPGTGQPE